MSVGIICLSTGPYSIFIDRMIERANEKFLLDHEKEYFIFTDSDFKHKEDKNITTIYKKRYGYPMDCLLRPQYAVELKEQTKHLDYIYFFNANTFIYKEVGDDILPDESGLVGVEHSGFSDRNRDRFTYERNPLSNAYIPHGEGNIYYQCCFWGGTTTAFMEMSEVMANWIKEDVDKNIIAVWFDESYLNRYYLNIQPKILPVGYSWPTSYPENIHHVDVRIAQLHKQDFISDPNFRYLH